MGEAALPLGLEGSLNLPKTKKILTNCFNNGAGDVLFRPCVAQKNTTGRVARGQFVFNDKLYQIVSQDLIRIDNVETGSYTVIGTIADPQRCVIAIGFNEAVIVVKGQKGYTLNTSETLTEITNANYLPSDSVAFINGRFVYIPSDGSPAFFSDVGAGGTIQAASFFDAEELPDKNSVCFTFGNILYVGGTDSLEQFTDTGADPVPFARRQGARISNGYIGGILEYNNTFLFIGREKDQDLGIYSIAQGAAPKVSNEYIDTILATYTITELSEAISGRFKWKGYDIATFTLKNHSFGFLGGNWFFLESQKNNTPVAWKGGYINHYQGKYYSAFEDKIGRLEAINTDYGDKVERRIELGIENEHDFSIQSIELGISQGFNTNDGSVALSMSQDNVLFGQPFYRNVADQGHYNNKLVWNYAGGLGYYRGFAGIRLSTTENIDFSAHKLYINFR